MMKSFSPDEKSMIRTHIHDGSYDKLFLLDIDEITYYLKQPIVAELRAKHIDSDQASVTSLQDESNLKKRIDSEKFFFWTRTPCPLYSYWAAHQNGKISKEYIDSVPQYEVPAHGGIRPAMWVEASGVPSDVLEAFRKLPPKKWG